MSMLPFTEQTRSLATLSAIARNESITTCSLTCLMAATTKASGKSLILLTLRLAGRKDIKDGLGVMFWPDGTKYEGTFHED